MKKLKKIIIVVVAIIVIVSILAYIDYFICKTNGTYPKLSLKEQIDENTTVYKAILYKVWYCDSNKTYTMGSYSDKAAICPKNYTYVDGYYTNASDLKISKKDLQMLTNDGVYSNEMVDNMNSEKQLEEALHVASEYGKIKYKTTNKSSSNGYKLVILPEFKEDKNGNYKWQYEEDEEKIVYSCLRTDKTTNYLAPYSNDECGSFEKIKMDSDWCKNYSNSMLVYEEDIDKLCEE